MYAMIATRHDIAFAVGVISRYMANPSKKHWEAVKGMLHYLKGMQEMCISFGRQDACVLGYMDANSAGHFDMTRFTFGYVLTFVGGAVSWMSCAQNCVSLSTIEVEFLVVIEA